MIRVCIFEDNKHLRETLEFLLNNTAGYKCVAAFADCDNIISHLESLECDVVLMDIEMPGMNGIDATKLLKSHFPNIHVLIQTVFFEDDYIFNAICNGASGYILKSTSPSGYIEAIKDVQSGGSPMTPGIARKMLEIFRDKVQPEVVTPVDHHLTNQEKKVLQLLVAGKSYKMIAAELFVAHDTIKTHISNIYSKLHVHSGTEAVAMALRDKIV